MKKEEIITKVINVIIDTMEKENKLPWDKGILPINGIEAISWSTGKPYTGVNRFILNMAGNRQGEYATFANIKIQCRGNSCRVWSYAARQYPRHSN